MVQETFGLKTVYGDFGNLQLLVLEVTPKSVLDLTEFDMIKKYWLKCLTESSIEANQYTINRTADFPSYVQDLLEKSVFGSEEAATSAR